MISRQMCIDQPTNHSQKVVDICVFHLMISVIVDTADDDDDHDDDNGCYQYCFIDHGLIDPAFWLFPSLYTVKVGKI